MLMAPKNKDTMTQNSQVIYRFKCDEVECDGEYIGETARALGQRLKQHFKTHPSSMITRPQKDIKITIDNICIVGREKKTLDRTMKEYVFIRANEATLNRHIGK